MGEAGWWCIWPEVLKFHLAPIIHSSFSLSFIFSVVFLIAVFPHQRPYDIHASNSVESLIQLFSTVSVQYSPAWPKDLVSLLRKVTGCQSLSAKLNRSFRVQFTETFTLLNKCCRRFYLCCTKSQQMSTFEIIFVTMFTEFFTYLHKHVWNYNIYYTALSIQVGRELQNKINNRNKQNCSDVKRQVTLTAVIFFSYSTHIGHIAGFIAVHVVFNSCSTGVCWCEWFLLVPCMISSWFFSVNGWMLVSVIQGWSIRPERCFINSVPSCE